VARRNAIVEPGQSVGLRPAVALANPARHETIRYGGEKIAAFLVNPTMWQISVTERFTDRSSSQARSTRRRVR